MLSVSQLFVLVCAACATSLAAAQAASAPAGWPRASLAGTAGSPALTVTVPPPPKLEKEYLEKRFRIVGDQVYDAKADLTWQRCDHGQIWDEGNAWCRGSRKHMTVEAMAEDVKARAPGWRLPEVGEVMAMLEVACNQSAKDTPLIFPEVGRSLYYLTSTPHSNPDSHMSAQCFGSQGMTSGLSKKYVSVTRLVRSGAPQ